MTTPLPYLLMTVKVIELKKVSLSDMQNIRTVYNTLAADDKYSLLNRDNLLQHPQMQLFQKQKTFTKLFFEILGI